MGISLSRYLSASIIVELIAIEEFSYEVFVTSFTDIMHKRSKLKTLLMDLAVSPLTLVIALLW